MGQSNMRRITYKGCDCLWVYGPTHQEGYLVLIAPYDEILKPARQAEAYIQTQINELLAITRYGVGAVLVVVVSLAFAFSRTVTKPMQILADGAERLAAGHFDTRVDIRSQDEFGDMGRVFNSVGPQLEANYQMRKSLDLAKEVQQNLLPKGNLNVDGLDIAGKSIYCDETGGDYFDFFDSAGHNTYGIVIGDVSDHGIPSALLMASARAFLRQRTALAGSIADIVGDVNRQLTRDVEDTGRFITLFYLQIDMDNRSLSWVRAGHEPALLFDPDADRFEELTGEGIALGVDGRWQYAESRRDGLGDGQIILLSTDGIWEARNPQDRMFGRETVSDIIRQHAQTSAAKIQDAILTELNRFQEGVAPADDTTLVVIKVRGQRAGARGQMPEDR